MRKPDNRTYIETDRRQRMLRLEDHQDHIEIELISRNLILYVVCHPASAILVSLHKVSQKKHPHI